MEHKKWQFWKKDPNATYVPRPTNKKWGNRVLNGKRSTEIVSYFTQIGVSAATVQILFPDLFPSLRESLYNFRHSTRTSAEVLRKGVQKGAEAIGFETNIRPTSGETGVANLEDALNQVKLATAKNKEAAHKLADYYIARREFVEEVAKTYKANETFARETERLGIQIKGMTKNLFEAGNDVKAQWWKDNIDRPIIVQQKRWFGGKAYEGMTDDQIVTKALEDSSRLREFYENARKFYDAREKNEATMREFCDYLASAKSIAEVENKEIEAQFPKLVSRLKEGYTIEDRLFEVEEKGTSMTPGEAGDVKTKTADYRSKVDNTRSEVSQVVPLSGYSNWNWADLLHPVTIAVVGVFAANSALRLFTPSLVYNTIQSGIGTPIKWTTKKLLNGASYLKDKIVPYKEN